MNCGRTIYACISKCCFKKKYIYQILVFWLAELNCLMCLNFWWRFCVERSYTNYFLFVVRRSWSRSRGRRRKRRTTMCVLCVALGGCWSAVTPAPWSIIWTVLSHPSKRFHGGNGSVSCVLGSPPKAKSSCPEVRRQFQNPHISVELVSSLSVVSKVWDKMLMFYVVAKAGKKKNQVKSTPNSSRASSRKGSPRESPITVKSGKKRDWESLEEDLSSSKPKGGKGRSKSRQSDINGGL